MTISYECEVPVRGVASKTRKALTSKLKAERYEWWYDNNTLIISGELGSDRYDQSADDVASDIEWIVEATTGISVTVNAREVEHEPDWDKMPGGYDAIWN